LAGEKEAVLFCLFSKLFPKNKGGLSKNKKKKLFVKNKIKNVLVKGSMIISEGASALVIRS
jgi:hypothetical protein